MNRSEDAFKFCKLHSLPTSHGWVVFLVGATYFDKATPFAWVEVLPYCFQPFRVMAVSLETGEHVRALGLGGKQRWEGVE